MKKVTFLLFLLCSIAITACSEKDDVPSIPEESGVTALVSTNPNDPVLLDISNRDGLSVMLMGDKTPEGKATSLNQAIINQEGEENSTELFFENGQISEIIATNGVRFQFNWQNDDEVALVLIDPNTNEQLNTVINLKEEKLDAPVKKQSRSIITREGGSKMKIEPLLSNSVQSHSNISRSTSNVIGNVYLEQCGVPTEAQCWVDVYDYSTLTGSFGMGKYRGRFPCHKVGEGHYQFSLPSNYNEHHNIADYCDAVNGVVNKICGLNAWTAPGSGAKQALCIGISATLASGLVSAPVAAGFLVACETTSVAIDAACGLINGNMDLPEGTPNLVDGLCGLLREINYTWDDPLLLVPTVNALPKNIYGNAQKYEHGTQIKDTKITWGGNPTITTFTLNPPSPVRGQNYNAIAQLYCLPEGSKITMDIVGTDGYTDCQTQTVGNQINFTATLSVPGAESGVKDVCTVKIITPSGQTISKKASLVFH